MIKAMQHNHKVHSHVLVQARGTESLSFRSFLSWVREDLHVKMTQDSAARMGPLDLDLVSFTLTPSLFPEWDPEASIGAVTKVRSIWECSFMGVSLLKPLKNAFTHFGRNYYYYSYAYVKPLGAYEGSAG